MARPRFRFTFLFAGVLQGFWLIADGFMIATGRMQDVAEARLWGGMVERIGLDPHRFGPILIVLGLAWLVVTFGILAGRPFMRRLGFVVAILSLWVLIEGTLLAAIYLLALVSFKDDLPEPEAG